MNGNGYSAYQSTKIDTADQGRLILIAYDVAIKHCKISLDYFEGYHLIEERAKHLMKAQDAIGELMGALKMETGEIAQNLHRLYEYMLHRLVEANVQSQKPYVEEVIGHLESLRTAWNQAIRNVKQLAAGPAPQPTNATAENQTKNFAISG